MKCFNCGKEVFETDGFCRFCGNLIKPAESFSQPVVYPVYEKFLAIFKDNIFLAICILNSVLTAFSFISGSVPILSILYTVFLWVIYSNAGKNIVQTKSLRNISGTVFAVYVIGWVVIGILAFCFLMMLIITISINNSHYSSIELNRIFREIISEYNLSPEMREIFSEMTYDYLNLLMIIASVFFAIASGMAIIVNVFGVRNIHKFAKSLYMSFENGNVFLNKVDAAKNWMLALGIINGLSALSTLSESGGLVALTVNGCTAAVYILAYALIKKYFKFPVSV